MTSENTTDTPGKSPTNSNLSPELLAEVLAKESGDMLLLSLLAEEESRQNITHYLPFKRIPHRVI